MSSYVRSVRWTLATTAGFVIGGIALHSPGASAIGASLYEWDLSAAIFGAFLGAIVGVLTGLLQAVALGALNWRVVLASVLAVGSAHALADGAPAAWSFGVAAMISGICAALALAWAVRDRAPRWIAASAGAWWAGWSLGVALAGALGLSFGTHRAYGRWSTQ